MPAVRKSAARSRPGTADSSPVTKPRATVARRWATAGMMADFTRSASAAGMAALWRLAYPRGWRRSPRAAGFASPGAHMTDLSVRKKLAPYRATNKVRFVTAAALFDGHDAAINIMRRILQASGAEVIHLGHNRSVPEVVNTALEEAV